MRTLLTLAVLALASTFAAAAVPARDARPQQRSDSAAGTAEPVQQPQQLAWLRGRWC